MQQRQHDALTSPCFWQALDYCDGGGGGGGRSLMVIGQSKIRHLTDSRNRSGGSHSKRCQDGTRIGMRKARARPRHSSDCHGWVRVNCIMCVLLLRALHSKGYANRPPPAATQRVLRPGPTHFL